MSIVVRRDEDRVGRAAALLALILAAVAAPRFAGLRYSLWNDEVASTQFAGAPLHLLWSDWMIRETNPPLYYTLLHGWVSVFGGGDVALRLMSVLIGCVGIVLLFALGRRVGGTWTGVVAAVLVGLSAQNILYSQQVRAYILAYAGAVAAMLAAIAFLAAARGAGSGRGRALSLYVLGATVAIYSHTTLILLPALIGAFVLARLLLASTRRWRPAAEWLAVNAMLLLLWSWWARITVLQAQTRRTIGWIDTPSLPYAVRMTLESYVPWQIGPAQYVVAALAIMAAGGGAWRWRRQPDHLLLPFLAAALPVLLYLLSLKVPMFLDRTVYWGSAPFLVTVAAGIAGLPPRWSVGAALIGAVASATGWAAWFPRREIERWQGTVAAIERQHPGATVVVSGKGPTLALKRYCQAPRCTLSITGLASPGTDTWASGFAVPGMAGEHAAPALLKQRGAIVAVRWMTLEPMAVPPAGSSPQPLAIPAGAGDNLAATLWRSRLQR